MLHLHETQGQDTLLHSYLEPKAPIHTNVCQSTKTVCVLLQFVWVPCWRRGSDVLEGKLAPLPLTCQYYYGNWQHAFKACMGPFGNVSETEIQDFCHLTV